MATKTDLKIRIAELEAALANKDRELTLLKSELEQQKGEMDSLHQFDRALTVSTDLDDMLNHVITWTRNRTSADYGLIAQWNTSQKQLEVLITSGFSVGQDYDVGETLHLPRYLMPREAIEALDTGVLHDPDKPIMVAELRHGDGHLIGILMLQRHNRFFFSEEDKKFMRILSDRLATAMHIAVLAQKIQNLSQHRKQLFRMLSHDLRQPITVLMGYLQLMDHALKNDRPEVLPSYLQHVMLGAQDLMHLLEEVLLMERVVDFSREDWEIISLLKACKLAIEKNSSQIELHNHKLYVHFPQENEAKCQGVIVELKEAASNLLNNAIKYTPNGGEITVRLYLDNGHWVYEVQDNGYGIDVERQARLYESFYRAQQPGTENIKGTGLGLNLVKTIVEKHHGQVFFDSRVGKGSTFGFWIPAMLDA